MRDAMTFGECLSALMRENDISVAELTRLTNYRSKTSLVRLLRDEVRFASIEDFMVRLRAAEVWEAGSREMRALEDAMEVSRLGRERYLRYREMWRLVGRREEEPKEMALEPFGTSRARTLRELAQKWRGAQEIRFLLINSGYESLFAELNRLLEDRPDLDAVIEQYLIVRDDPGSLARQMNAMKTVFHDARYLGFCSVLTQEELNGGAGYGLNGDALIVSGRDGDGAYFCQMITVLSEERGLLYENEGSDDFPAFFRKSVERICRDALPFRAQYPEQELLEGLITLSRRYLECEQDRATYCLAPNICFELIPFEILYRVMFDSVLAGADPEAAQIKELSRIQKARYANIYGKRRPTVFVFDWESMKEFSETGYTTDHVTGMRAFTRRERREILAGAAAKARGNEYLQIHILKPGIRPRGMTLTAYDALGVYLLDANTQYDVVRGHSEVFLQMPDFAQALESFFRDELIEKCCYPEEESLRMLEELAEGLMG